MYYTFIKGIQIFNKNVTKPIKILLKDKKKQIE